MLHEAQREVLLGDRVGVSRRRGSVAAVHLGPQRAPLERPVGLLRLERVEPVRQHGVRQPHRGRGGRLAGAAQRGLGPVLPGVRGGDGGGLLERPGVEPGAGEHRRRPGPLVPVDEVAVVERRVGAELLGVPLLDHAEPAELPLVGVVVAVVVGVPGDQPAAADPVDGLDPLDDLHGERQPGHPRPAGARRPGRRTVVDGA